MSHRRVFALSILTTATLLLGCDTSTTPTSGSWTALHTRPFWSPAGDRIAFTRIEVGSLGLWSVDTNGNDLRLIHSGNVGGGTWSPDGEWVAFYGETQIVARNVTNDSLRVLVTGTDSQRPAWSPDGATLAFVRNGIVALKIATGSETLLSPTGSYVQWFPGTNELLVGTSLPEGTTYAFVLLRVDPDSLETRELMTIRTKDDCGFFVPSPDGSTIFYGRKPYDLRPEVWSAKPASQEVKQLTTDGGDFPAISPNGQWVVYTRTAPDDGGLWLMRPDGSGKKRLTLAP